LAAALWLQSRQLAGAIVERTRNFYGVLTVFEHNNQELNLHYFELSHGRTEHGLQFADAERSAWPTLYYSENGGAGLCLRAMTAEHRRIGLVGLGAGTLATYARAGDYVHIYEINPEVERLARSRFTFLSGCPAKIETTLGDARLSLEREPPQHFDLLVLDAFSSDAIPVHLLTKEAFAIYERHLNPDGIVAVHISNKSLNLEPVVANLAREFQDKLLTVDAAAPKDKPWVVDSIWMLLSRSGEILDGEAMREAARPAMTGWAKVPLWTDDFASLFQILDCWEPRPRTDSAALEAQMEPAKACYQRGDFAGVIACMNQAVKQQPDAPVLLNNLAFLLVTCPDAKLRDPKEAIRLAEWACALTRYRAAPLVGTLAAVYSEAGRFSDAKIMAGKTCALAAASGDEALLQKNRELLELYRAGRPFLESLPTNPPAQ
jgi:predicted O-methyltransferase YrrM